jgi:hypothetical protein
MILRAPHGSACLCTAPHGSAWLHHSGRRVMLTLRHRLLEASLLEFGVTPRRRHAVVACGGQAPSKSHRAHNGGTTCANYNRHWHWFGNDMKFDKKNCSLWISPRWPSLSPKRTSRRNAGSSGFFGWFRRFCRRLPPCMALLVTSAGHPTNFETDS